MACSKSSDGDKLDIVGEWQIIDIDVKSASIGGEDVDVYISFKSDGSFVMYQMLGTGRYYPFAGSWFLKGNILSGSYSDGQEWGNSYEIELIGDRLILTSTNGLQETDTYIRTVIPDSVITVAE